MFPPCTKKTTYFILTDILTVSEVQLKNFPGLIKNNNKIVQHRENREIYITTPFDKIGEKINEAHAIVSKNIEKENQDNLIKINKILSEIKKDVDKTEMKQFVKALNNMDQEQKLKEQKEKEQMEANFAAKVQQPQNGETTVSEETTEKLVLDQDKKAEVEEKLEIVKEFASEITGQKQKQEDIKPNDSDKIPFEKVKEAALKLDEENQKIEYNQLGTQNTFDPKVQKEEENIPKTQIYLQSEQKLQELKKKLEVVELQISKNLYKNTPIGLLQYKRAKNIIKNNIFIQKIFCWEFFQECFNWANYYIRF